MRRTGRNRTRVLDAIRHFHSPRAVISADKECLLRTPDGSARKVRCLYTHIAPRVYTRPWDGKKRTGSGSAKELGRGNVGGNGAKSGDGDVNVYGDSDEEGSRTEV